MLDSPFGNKEPPAGVIGAVERQSFVSFRGAVEAPPRATPVLIRRGLPLFAAIGFGLVVIIVAVATIVS